MCEKIIVYTDASYRDSNHRGGFAFLYIYENQKIEPQIIYGSCNVKSSTAAELTAIIMAINYLQESQVKNHVIEIRSDELSIVDNLRTSKYEEWIKLGWKKPSGAAVTKLRSISEWYKLAILLKMNTDNIFTFTKSKESEDIFNKIVHRYSRLGIWSNNVKPDLYYAVKKDCKIVAKSEFMTIPIHFSEDTLMAFNEKPWEGKSNKKGSSTSIGKSEAIRWFNAEKMEVQNINIDNILLTEDIHLKCQQIQFCGTLKRILKNKGNIMNPIAVRPIDGSDGKYTLVVGMKNLCALKILQCNKYVPCVITNETHDNFIEKYSKD